MKGIFCACLLVSLQSSGVAQAYEGDIHFSSTYVLARAVGWPEADALVIASANQGVDENQETVAALEMDTTANSSFAAFDASSFHQAEKNLRFHCFSKHAGQAGRISADVLEVVSGHFAEVPDRGEAPRSHARRLIALGVALHCQQDAYSHVGFGGSCGSHSGSCYGHTYETFFDQVVFGLLNRHYFNPDHPGVSGQHLLEALRGTASELAARRPKTSSRSIPTRELVALSDALRGSGLELADDVRRECNRYIAGKWLVEFLRSAGKTPDRPDAIERLAPGVALTCKNPSLASASIVRIPEPRYPRLNPDTSPHLVRADGTYQLMQDGDFDVSLPDVAPEGTSDPIPNYNSRKVRVRLSHWSQLLALPLMTRVALLSR